ncbi:hypothetical protein HPB51_001448 [Rhipicephalus microplus]|uniref:Nose resistant-to-fluoxetine protein N-terminal domain-containing protein n=1 Tax=Rhipicephalus microplus TaxID=6941 RepID=A0A9J6EEF7_RHIMP|nr:hypothetical protein HPB51_001448 [Rhipicephalus microplus]
MYILILWAVIDAAAKYPNGMLQGTLSDLGAYDECIETVLRGENGATKLRGQYCDVHLSLGDDDAFLESLLPFVLYSHTKESWRLVPEPVLVPLVVESWRRVPEPALAPLFQEGWRGFPRRTTGAQGHNSPPPEHVSRRLQFVDSGAEPLEFDAATLRLPTSSLQVTTPPIVDFATECCRRGINDGPGYYPDDLNLREVRRSRQDYLVGRLAHRYDPGHVATLVLAEWTAQPPLDDRSRRAGAWFLNLSLSRWSWRAGAGCLNLPLRRCSRRAGVGSRGGLQVLKGTTPRRRNTTFTNVIKGAYKHKRQGRRGQELLRLRSLAPTRHQPPKLPIYNQEDLDLPQHVSKVLSLGPKFAVEPKRSPHDLLATVRRVSRRASPEEQDRRIADGVDVLSRCKASLSTPPVKCGADFMKEHTLCVLPAAKEGGFAIMFLKKYREKACRTVAALFNCHAEVSTKELKSK